MDDKIPKTLVVNNFHGTMTPYFTGDINSGKAYVQDVFGYDPFNKPNLLTWNEQAIQIDEAGSVITDLVLDGKVRVESGITYVYAIGHTGRLYKIQVNNPATYNPDLDSPTLLATLSQGTPTFTRGGFLDFFGSTERIYIGHDKGVTRIDFNGTNETVVGVAGSWTQNVPRPFIQFLGKLYIGNGANLAEIDSTATVTSYTKLTPGFPSGSQVRDLEVTPDGNYLIAAVTKQALSDITVTTPDTTIIAPADSYIFRWTGTEAGYTSFTTYPSMTISSIATFGNQEYAFGYDFLSGGIYNPVNKILTSTPRSAFSEPPFPNAVKSISNTITWMTPLPYEGHLEVIYLLFGTISEYEQEPGYWCPYDQTATGDETDVLRVPCQILVSNFAQGSSLNGYTNSIFGQPKIYFSTIEISESTTKYKLYKWAPVPTGLGTAYVGALYQTQNQLFSKKIVVKEVRVYGESWVADNAFTIELIGPDQTPIDGTSMTFTAGSNLTIGENMAQYNPSMAPTYSIGLRVINEGEVNHTILKVEIDWDFAGK